LSKPRCVPAPPEQVLFDFVDVNGDRIPDLVSQSFVTEQLQEVPGNTGWNWCDPSAAPRAQLNVWPGTGLGFSAAPVLMPIENEALASNCLAEDPTIVVGQLVDVNGDGLADFLESRATETGLMYYDWPNVGWAFASTQQNLLGPLLSVTVQQRQFRDLDHDGLIDFSCLSGACIAEIGGFNATGIAFGSGVGFRAPASAADVAGEGDWYGPDWYVPGEFLGATARVQEEDNYVGRPIAKHLVRDWLDLDGNGVPERYKYDPFSASQAPPEVWSWSPPPDEAPGLLKRIDNGRGGLVKFRYAPSSDAQYVHFNGAAATGRPSYATGWSDWVQPSMASPVWVVHGIDVSADGGATTETTDYVYDDPVVMPDDPTLRTATTSPEDATVLAAPGQRFRGFQAVTASLPFVSGQSQPQIFTRYSYLKDPDGLADYTARRGKRVTDPPLEFPEFPKETVDGTIYAVERYFGNWPCPDLVDTSVMRPAPRYG
jgi:hypothetical protein